MKTMVTTKLNCPNTRTIFATVLHTVGLLRLYRRKSRSPGTTIQTTIFQTIFGQLYSAIFLKEESASSSYLAYIRSPFAFHCLQQAVNLVVTQRLEYATLSQLHCMLTKQSRARSRNILARLGPLVAWFSLISYKKPSTISRLHIVVGPPAHSRVR